MELFLFGGVGFVFLKEKTEPDNKTEEGAGLSKH